MIYQPSPVANTRRITISDASVTLTLQNNSLYYLTNANITAIDLDSASGFLYGGFDFETGSSEPTFSYPADGTNDWVFCGADCEDGVFIPQAEKRYRVAIEEGFGTFVGTVQEVPIL